MTTASLPLSTAAPPLEVDDLLSEILLRLPPQPSSLPRASAVCTRWRRLLSDRAFHRRFRIHHRRSPPLAGFIDAFKSTTIHPALCAPDRLPPGHFSAKIDDHHFRTLGWRHGLALFFLPSPLELLLWDPVAGDLHRLDVPPEFKLEYDPLEKPISGAVLPAAGDDPDNFRVVLVGISGGKQHRRAHASVYSSETGVWGDFVSTPLPSGATVPGIGTAVLAGCCLYWLTHTTPGTILEFDLDRQSLAVTSVPAYIFTDRGNRQLEVIRAEDGGMGFLFLSDYTAQIWKRETDCDGVVSWARGRTIELDKLFPPNSEKDYLSLVGYAEENNVMFFWTVVGVFMLHLETLQFKRTSEANSTSCHYPFELVYTPGIGGGHNGAKVMRRWWYTRWTRYITRLFS